VLLERAEKGWAGLEADAEQEQYWAMLDGSAVISVVA